MALFFGGLFGIIVVVGIIAYVIRRKQFQLGPDGEPKEKGKD